MPFVNCLFTAKSIKRSLSEPWILSMRKRESKQHVCLHPRDRHLSDALGYKQKDLRLQVVIIPRAPEKKLLQVFPLKTSKLNYHQLCGGFRGLTGAIQQDTETGL